MRVCLIIILLFCISYTQAQDITGKIIDANSNPVELAVVVVQTEEKSLMLSEVSIKGERPLVKQYNEVNKKEFIGF